MQVFPQETISNNIMHCPTPLPHPLRIDNRCTLPPVLLFNTSICFLYFDPLLRDDQYFIAPMTFIRHSTVVFDLWYCSDVTHLADSRGVNNNGR